MGDGQVLHELEVVMAKKHAAKKNADSTKKEAKRTRVERIILAPDQDKALRLVHRSAKIRAELKEAVTLAVAKAVRKVMNDHGIPLTPTQANVLISIWFGE
jgi:hypothetical protein